MESRLEKHKRYQNKLERHISLAKESSKYSSDRFDILLISLSTTALALSIGFTNRIFDNLNCINTSLLKISWLLFSATLIINLISQVTGFYANQYDIKATKNIIREERGKKPKGSKIKIELICKKLNNATLILNGLSLLSLIVGLILLVLFFSNNL